MINTPNNDDTKVFNMKTFRDPLSNIIEIDPKSHFDLKKISRQKVISPTKSTLINDSDYVKIWNPSSINR